MSAGSLFFAFCSIVCLVGALGVILARNPIRCAVGLLATIMGIAGLFLRLNAQFLAAIQLIVYAGAVVILFVFVIMLLGPDAGIRRARGPTARVARAVSGLLVLALGVAGIALLGSSTETPHRLQPVPESHGSIEAVGHQIFREGIVPFELATALLIVAVIGAIAVARSNPGKKKAEVLDHETRRLFHGPLHPRDAGRPLPKGGGMGSAAAAKGGLP